MQAVPAACLPARTWAPELMQAVGPHAPASSYLARLTLLQCFPALEGRAELELRSPTGCTQRGGALCRGASREARGLAVAVHHVGSRGQTQGIRPGSTSPYPLIL